MSALPRWVLLATLVSSAPVQADETVHPWQGLDEGFSASFTWPYIAFPIAAVAVTPPLVVTTDEPVQRWFQRENPLGPTFAEGTLIAGGILPIALPAGLYLGGIVADSDELATAGAAAVQAAAVQAVYVTTLKWLTDRKGPYPDGDPSKSRWSKGVFRDSEHADEFDFDAFSISGGLRWPSGHTASNVAVVSALYGFHADQWWIAALGYPASLAIGVGMIEGDYHWLSDIVAGALVGHVIGWTIGRSFRRRFEEARNGHGERAAAPELPLVLLPRASAHGAELAVAGQF